VRADSCVSPTVVPLLLELFLSSSSLAVRIVFEELLALCSSKVSGVTPRLAVRQFTSAPARSKESITPGRFARSLLLIK
jgi:hypothetical protein